MNILAQRLDRPLVAPAGRGELLPRLPGPSPAPPSDLAVFEPRYDAPVLTDGQFTQLRLAGMAEAVRRLIGGNQNPI